MLLFCSYLRVDTLAIMLSYSNIHSGSKVVVVDGVQGLLLAAAMERTGGRGKIVHIHPGPQPIMYVSPSFFSHMRCTPPKDLLLTNMIFLVMYGIPAVHIVYF